MGFLLHNVYMFFHTQRAWFPSRDAMSMRDMMICIFSLIMGFLSSWFTYFWCCATGFWSPLGGCCHLLSAKEKEGNEWMQSPVERSPWLFCWNVLAMKGLFFDLYGRLFILVCKSKERRVGWISLLGWWTSFFFVVCIYCLLGLSLMCFMVRFACIQIWS